MDRFMYIQGINGEAGSRSYLLAETLGCEVQSLTYDCTATFERNLAGLREQLHASVDKRRDRVCLVGVSLGGFYALQLVDQLVVHTVAFNPVVYPLLQLAPMLGENANNTTGQTWPFTKEILLSYAQAADTRPEKLCRDVVLGTRDERLDPDIAAAYWGGVADIVRTDEAHCLESFADFRELFQKKLYLQSFAKDWVCTSELEKKLLHDELAEDVFIVLPVHNRQATADETRETLRIVEAYAIRSSLARVRLTGDGVDKAGRPTRVEQAVGIWLRHTTLQRYSRMLMSLARHCHIRELLMIAPDGRICKRNLSQNNACFDVETWHSVPCRGFVESIEHFLQGTGNSWTLRSVGKAEYARVRNWLDGLHRQQFELAIDASSDPVRDHENRCSRL